MTHVLLTGASTPAGRRVAARLTADDDVETVTLLTRRRRSNVNDGKIRTLRADVGDAAAVDAIASADIVVHTAFVVDQVPGRSARTANTALVDGLVRAMADDAMLVVVSSGSVYGAWPDNPMPLTEAAPVRPNPGFGHGEDRARVERRARAWREERDGARLAVLRTAPVVADDWRSWLADRLLSEAAIESSDHDPSWQFLHLDDLVDAIVHTITHRLDGDFNVAPDDWLTGSQRRALRTGRPRLRLPDPAVAIARQARSYVSDPTAGITPYLTHSWVLANGRLRSTGWEPRWPSDEALVVAEGAPAWAGLNAHQRQALSLGGLGAVSAGAVAGASWLIRRSLRS